MHNSIRVKVSQNRTRKNRPSFKFIEKFCSIKLLFGAEFRIIKKRHANPKYIISACSIIKKSAILFYAIPIEGQVKKNQRFRKASLIAAVIFV